MVSQMPLPLLVQLLGLIDHVPLTPSSVSSISSAARRGRPCVYSERLSMKAVVVMVVRHLPTVHALLVVLEQPDMAAVRAALLGGEQGGSWPTRRTFERRRKALPAHLPAQIAALGTYLLGELAPWAAGSRAVAIDSTPAAASGTRSTARPARYPTPALTPRHIGPNRAGTAGSTATNCTSS